MSDDREKPDAEPTPGDEPPDSFEIEDARWAARRQLIDWVWLAVMMVAATVWAIVVYALEPGLR
jgi:hypothetical protein